MGETKSLFRRGRSPRHPCTEPLAALTVPAQQVLRRLNPRGTGCPCRTGARGGLVLFAVRLPCRCGVRRGACPLCRLPTLPSPFFLPPSPQPPPGGKGETKSLFRRGLRPRHPGIKPPAALIVSAKQVPSAAGSLRFGAKPIEHAFLWAVPVVKERGDRGRGTSAFEMVLSPGAGRASAVGGKPPAGYRGGVVSRRLPGQAPRRVPPTPAEPVPCPAQPWGCKGRSPLHKKTKSLPLPRRGRGLGGYPSPSGKGGKNKAKGRAGRRQRRQAPRRVPGRHLSPSKKSKARNRALTSPLNNYIRKSSWGFGGFFQEAPNASLTHP